MRIDLEVPQTIDLKKDAPEFADIGGRVVKDILLKELRYTADNQIGARPAARSRCSWPRPA